jgi:hypothetical protein
MYIINRVTYRYPFFYFPTHNWLSIIWSIKEDDQAPAIMNLTWLWHHFHLALDWTGIAINPRPPDREPSALPLDHSFRLMMSVKSFSIFVALVFWFCLTHMLWDKVTKNDLTPLLLFRHTIKIGCLLLRSQL